MEKNKDIENPIIFNLVKQIKEWFNENGQDCNAVLGISGGKDSTVAAMLLVKALGKERVIGVMMPNGVQYDIKDSQTVIEKLGIKNFTINIWKSVKPIFDQLDKLSQQTIINLPPRIRMSTLYAISQSHNGRVINTSNKSELFVGYGTKWGDLAGDLAILANLTKTQVVEIGKILAEEYDMPIELIEKAPSDGLTGMTDEDIFKVTYKDIDDAITFGKFASDCIKHKIVKLHERAVKIEKPMTKYKLEP